MSRQEEAAARTMPEKPRLTREAADRLREKESFQLALQNVIQQLERSRDSRHRSMLESARSDLQQQIEELNNSGQTI
jgi:hypothetical protein